MRLRLGLGVSSEADPSAEEGVIDEITAFFFDDHAFLNQTLEGAEYGVAKKCGKQEGSTFQYSVFSVSGFGFRVSGLRFKVQSFGFRVSGFGFRVSGFGFRVTGFGFWVIFLI